MIKQGKVGLSLKSNVDSIQCLSSKSTPTSTSNWTNVWLWSLFLKFVVFWFREKKKLCPCFRFSWKKVFLLFYWRETKKTFLPKFSLDFVTLYWTNTQLGRAISVLSKWIHILASSRPGNQIQPPLIQTLLRLLPSYLLCD